MDLVRRFGAEHAFDYSDPECAAEIRRYTGGTLAYTLDCVAMADTTQLCYNAMGRAGGRYVTLEPFRSAIAETRALTIEPSWLLALTVFGRKVDIDGEYSRDARPDDHKFAVELTVSVQALLDQGKFDTHPIKVMTGGVGWCQGGRGYDSYSGHVWAEASVPSMSLYLPSFLSLSYIILGRLNFGNVNFPPKVRLTW